MVQHAILSLVAKTMGLYVIFALDSCVTSITFFLLWMLKSRYDILILVITFVNSLWVPCHVIVELFEAIDTFEVAMVAQINDLLSSYNFLNKLITYVKDEGGNLSTFTQVLILIISCGFLGLGIP